MSDVADGKSETEVIEGVIGIVEKHFAAAGREFRFQKSSRYWWSIFGINLSSAVVSHVNRLDDPEYVAFARGMFEEIFDFLMEAYNGNPDHAVAELSRGFGSGMLLGPLQSRLLPERAQPVIDAADQLLTDWAEEDRRREDQMGY